MAYSSKWETRPLYTDELDQYIPIEMRRNRPDAGVGVPPPDRVITQMKTRPPKKVFADISGTRDGILQKEILDSEAEDGACLVLQGAKVVVQITVTRADRDLKMEERILHGPKQHSWCAGSGLRCELVELAVASMRVGERCVVRCADPSLFADAPLGVTADAKDVEYCLHVLDAQPMRLPTEASAMLARAEKEKEAAGQRLREGMVQLALAKYRLLTSELPGEHEALPGNRLPYADGVSSLRRILSLNSAACLLRLERWSAAKIECDVVLAEDSRNVKALFRRGQAKLKMGNLPSAKDDFASALEADPENGEAKKQFQRCETLLGLAQDREQFRKERKGQVDPGKWG